MSDDELDDQLVDDRHTIEGKRREQQRRKLRTMGVSIAKDGRMIIKGVVGNVGLEVQRMWEAMEGNAPELYVREGSTQLFMVKRTSLVEHSQLAPGGVVQVQSAALEKLSVIEAQAILGERFTFERTDDKGKVRRYGVTKDHAAYFLAHGAQFGFPSITSVTGSPVMRRDGRLIAAVGYDRTTARYVVADIEVDPIPAKPTKAQALTALNDFRHLLSGFPAEDELSLSVLIASLLTPLARNFFPAVPMFLIAAPTKAAGKSLFADCVSCLLRGKSAPMMTMGRNREEFITRLESAVMRGDEMIVIDNVDKPIQGDVWSSILTSPTCHIRKLGGNEMVSVSNNFTVVVTGIAPQVHQDMTRRVVKAVLQPNVERPELRRDFAFDPKTLIWKAALYL